MEENKFEFEQLSNNWMSLYREFKKTKKINFDVFNETFSKTYHLFVQQVAEPHIEKKYLSIIVNASLFAHIDISDNVESRYKAALVLTERMLNIIMTNRFTSSSNEDVIYILELRQEIYINFDNITESIDTLAKLYEADYWDKVNK